MLGAFIHNSWIAIFAASGVILSAAYALFLYRRIIFGALVDRVSWLAPFYVISGVMLGSALLWAFLIDPERLVTDRS